MKLKEGLVIEQLGEEYVAVATQELSKEFNGMLRGNRTFAYLMNQLMESHTSEELVQSLRNRYEIDDNQARREVDKFLQILSSANLLEEV